jgi:hypothetical protein
VNAAPALIFPTTEWRWTLRDSGLAPRLKDLARLMADYADERGQLWPSVETLRLAHVQDRGVGDRLNTPTLHAKKTVERRLDQLIAAGWLERVSKGGIRGGAPIATVYRLAFPTDSFYGQLLRTVGVASSTNGSTAAEVEAGVNRPAVHVADAGASA